MTAMSTAQEFWNAMARSVPAQCIAITRWAQILAAYTDDQIEEARAAVVADLQQHGVDTDLPSFVAAYADTVQNSLAFWQGQYLLRSDDGELFSLWLSEDALQLVSLTQNTVLVDAAAGFSLAAQTLRYEDDAVGLQLALGFTDPTVGADPQTLFDQNDRIFQGVQSGSLTRKGATPATTALTGKEGVFTVAGLESPLCGDPLAVWTGRYDCAFTDGGDDFAAITVGIGAQGAVQLVMDGQAIANAVLRNNCVGFSQAAGASTCARLICDPNGVRVMEGIVQSADGSLRPFRGTADVQAASAVRRRASPGLLQAAPPASLCDVANDQRVDMGTLDTPVLAAVPVQYQDGSSGTIEIRPVRVDDVYRVPPGQLVAYHQADASGRAIRTDAALAVGWLASQPLPLRAKVPDDDYQLRLSIDDWYRLDQFGIGIALNQDDPQQPGCLTVTAPEVSQCPVGSVGACSPIGDFSRATALLAASGTTPVGTSLQYRFELTGKSPEPDNCSRTRDGFLQVTLRFLTAAGTEKMPPRKTSLTLLLDAVLPTDASTPLQVTAPTHLPLVGQGRKFSATVQATGGRAPYVATLVSAGNPLGLQCDAGTSPEPGVMQWTVSGVVPVDAAAGSHAYTLCVQSAPDEMVSTRFVPLNVGVFDQGPPWAYMDYVAPPLRRAGLIALWSKLFGSWAFYRWHAYLADYGPLAPFQLLAYQRAAARMTVVFLQPLLASLGQPAEGFFISWYSNVENYARMGGMLDELMANLDSWKPFIQECRAGADDAWRTWENLDNDLLTRMLALAKWFVIDEILYILNVERMATHEEIETYLAARNNALPKP